MIVNVKIFRKNQIFPVLQETFTWIDYVRGTDKYYRQVDIGINC